MTPKKSQSPKPDKKVEKKVDKKAAKSKEVAKDENRPKRATSAYLYFNMEMTKKLRSKDSSLSQKEAMKTAGEIWGTMDDAKKEKWTNMQKEDEKRYEKQVAEYDK